MERFKDVLCIVRLRVNIFHWNRNQFHHLMWQSTNAKEGFALHRVLPRALERLSNGNPTNHRSKHFENMFDAVGFTVHEADEDLAPSGGGEADWLEKLVHVDDEADDTRHDLSFQEINQKRKQLTFMAFRQEDFADKISILESLVAPNVDAMHLLFQRTGHLSKMNELPRGPSLAKLAEKILDGTTVSIEFLHLLTKQSCA